MSLAVATVAAVYDRRLYSSVQHYRLCEPAVTDGRYSGNSDRAKFLSGVLSTGAALFAAQRLHRIDLGRSPRRQIARNQNAKGEQRSHCRDDCVTVCRKTKQYARSDLGEGNGERKPCHEANHGDMHTLPK